MHGPAVLSVSVSLLNEKCQRAQSQQTSKPQSELWSDLSRSLCVRCLTLLCVKKLLQSLKVLVYRFLRSLC